MLELLLGRNQNTITGAVLDRAIRPVRGRRNLVIVPEQYSHVTERRMCRAGGDRVSEYAEVLTFSRLAQRVFQECGGSARPVLDKGGRLLLMFLAVRRLAPELEIYARAGRQVSFLSGLIATADECKSCCISPELLLEAGEAAEGDSGKRLRELGLILGAYDALTAQRAEDPRDRLTRLAETLKATDYLRDKAIFLDGFTDFTPQEKLVLGAMLRRSCGVTVGLRCDSLEPGGLSLFAPTRQTGLGLIDLARDNGSGVQWQTLPNETGFADLRHLEAQLNAPMPEPFAGQAEHIAILSATDPYVELERVAEEMLRLVREEGFRFRDITLCARSLEEWGPRMEQVLGQYGIPVFVSQMDDILQKPVLTLLTSALDALSGGYEYDDIFRYLKTGLTGISREERDLLENYVLRWDIRGSRWTTDKAWRWHPDGYGQRWKDEDHALVERLDGLRRGIVAPLEALRRSGSGTGADLARAVYAFLEAIDLPACLTRRTEELISAGELREAEEYRQVWEILTGALEQCADLLGEDRMELSDFAELFRLVLSQYQVGTIPVSLDRVTCSDMPRISHAAGKVLFLVGADDDSLPSINAETGLLTDEDRALLRALGVETALGPDGRMDREMMLIYECATMPEEKLCVSCARQGLDGAEKRPSFLIHRLALLFPDGTAPWPETGIPGALRPALERAAARGDLPQLHALSALPGGEVGKRADYAREEQRENLTPEAVRDLYAGTLRLSASRMDKVKSCHYAYFLQYGIGAKARKQAGLDAPESGTFVHFVLETVLRAARETGGVGALEQPRLEELCREATRQYIRENLGGLEDKSPRFTYLFRRLAASAVRVVSHMVEELKASDFEPIAFELGFGGGQDLPPVQLDVDGFRVSISGFVDRVDGWFHEGRLYLRVMDYKTGRKSFDFTDVWHGLNLQMLLYLFTLEDEGVPGHDETIVPAGVLYLPAMEGRIAGSREMTEHEWRKEMDKKLKRSGLILDDPEVVDAMEHIPEGQNPRFLPVRVSKGGAISGDCLATAEQLGRMRRHIQRILREIAREIGGGNIAADPCYHSEQDTACRYCDYASACHFADGVRGEKRRYLYPVSGKEFWERTERPNERKGD